MWMPIYDESVCEDAQQFMSQLRPALVGCRRTCTVYAHLTNARTYDLRVRWQLTAANRTNVHRLVPS